MWWNSTRSGNEPLNARSALTLRLVLAAIGVVFAIGGALFFGLVVGSLGWVIGFAVAGALIAVDLAVVIRHIRQGPHFQPGPSTPPYRPVDRPSRLVLANRPTVPVAVRRRRYIVLVSISLVLLVLAWTVVHPFSVIAAVVMSLVALLLLPVAVIVANTGSPVNRQ